GGTEDHLMAVILRLGKALHLTTVAEGVEEPEQLERLRELGCDLVQGYLLARPLDAAAVDVLLDHPQTPAGSASVRSDPAG
ncbi:MAG: EAL domain-containing protein, partial [Gaiellaceae bacterium]